MAHLVLGVVARKSRSTRSGAAVRGADSAASTRSSICPAWVSHGPTPRRLPVKHLVHQLGVHLLRYLSGGRFLAATASRTVLLDPEAGCGCVRLALPLRPWLWDCPTARSMVIT